MPIQGIRAKLEQMSIPEPNSGCRLWLGASDGRYGVLRVGGRPENGGTLEKAHRLAYVEAHGPIPAGHDVLHKCDVTFCIEETHLYAGTKQRNMADMMGRGRGKGQFKPGSNRPQVA